ncbi:MAG: glycosyltransferase family 2 protein [Candidatus Kapabacteria bacterium]|nr:glycosyltransferase family 2 protein [Candidatus Kapabacteria bacterium]
MSETSSSKQSGYDVAIAYRVYPGVSKTPFIHRTDKRALAELGVASLRRSLGHVRAKVWAILDGCPDDYEQMMLRYFDAADLVILRSTAKSNAVTFSMQIDLLLEQTDADIVYFAEDDYLYRADSFAPMLDILRERTDIDFATPYDHLDYYTHPVHPPTARILTHGETYWRTATSTCLTFATRKATLRETQHVFRTFIQNNYDTSIWFALCKSTVWNPFMFLRSGMDILWLAKTFVKAWLFTPAQLLFGRRRTLVAPMPSIATHAEITGIAPAVDWQRVVEETERYIAAKRV